MPRKIAPIKSTQKARQNIKLLEDADKLAISKIKSPKNQKYKNVLRKQEEQLHHYLKQYTDPNYLPNAIAKEYEFPKYFYYTVNGKNGIVHKRTRTDSAMFAKFMNNPEKKQQAEAQGLFNKAPPIKRNKTEPEQIVEKKKPSLEIMPFEGEELIESIPSYEPTKKDINIQRRKKIEPVIDEDELALLEEYIEEAERDAKIAKDEAKKAQEYAKESAAKVKVLRMVMVNGKEEQLLDWGDSGTPLTFRKFQLSINPTTRPKPRTYDSDEDEAASRALDRFFTLEEKKNKNK